MSVKKVTLASGEARWRVRVYVGTDPDTGRQEVVTRTYSRKKDADAEEARLRNMKTLGALATPSKEPLAKYLRRWLSEVKEGQLRPRTLYDYHNVTRRYIERPPEGVPPVGKIRLDSLTPAAFQTLYSHLWKEMKLAPRTIQYLHTILRQALSHAVLVGALPRNPTDGVRPPRQKREREAQGGERRAMRAMTREEAGRFLLTATEDRYCALWHVLLLGGLRPGEAMGLLWEDVNLEEGKLHVRRALTRRGVSGWQLTEPKTERARRVVPLPGVAARAVREWRKKQAEERLLLGTEWEDNGLVFTTEFGAPLDGANISSRNFRRILEAADLGSWEGEGEERVFRPGFRVYDLRHTCATLLLLAGENPKVVSERLGHASITLTLDTYSHVLPDMQERAAEKLEAMFGTS